MKKANENEIIEAIGDLRDLMAQQFEGVRQQFDGVNKKFDNVNEQFINVNSQLYDVKEESRGINARLDRLEHNQDLHTNVLDKHTKMLIDLKHEQVFALNRTERIEKDALMLKKKLKTT